jgi:hypothetical protein
MSYDDFLTLLKKAGLTPNEFASKTRISNAAVLVWAREGRVGASWADSWLELFLENKEQKNEIEVLWKKIGRDISSEKEVKKIVQPIDDSEIWLTVGKDKIISTGKKPLKIRINNNVYKAKNWIDTIECILRYVVEQNIVDTDTLMGLKVLNNGSCGMYTGLEKRQNRDRVIAEGLFLWTNLASEDVVSSMLELSSCFGLEISLVLNK